VNNVWVIPAGLLFAGICITGLHTYWFHPRRVSVPRQDRAIVLAYYLTGPLAVQFIPCCLMIAGYLAYNVFGVHETVVVIAAGAAGIGTLICWGTFYLNTLQCLELWVRSEGRRRLAAAITLPLCWLASLAVGLVVWPWVAGFVWTWIDSYRS
jgi:hypothetical protein